MRLNKFIAKATGISRRKVDGLIEQGKVQVNNNPAKLGLQVSDSDKVTLNGTTIKSDSSTTLIAFNKPVGYICSREGQGSKTVYELLPSELTNLKTVGRLDKQSSGLLLLTNDGDLMHELLHPSQQKRKVYKIKLNKSLSEEHQNIISQTGVDIGDKRKSKFIVEGSNMTWTATLEEGRNRQIRRTFEKLGYKVTALQRTNFGKYELGGLKEGEWIKLDGGS